MFDEKVKKKKQIYITHEFTIRVRKPSIAFSFTRSRATLDTILVKARRDDEADDTDDIIVQEMGIYAARNIETGYVKRYLSKTTYLCENFKEIERTAIKNFYVSARTMLPNYYGECFSIYTFDVGRIAESGHAILERIRLNKNAILDDIDSRVEEERAEEAKKKQEQKFKNLKRMFGSLNIYHTQAIIYTLLLVLVMVNALVTQ